MKEEKWRDVKGFEGFYQVSDLGNVRSLPRITTVHQVHRTGKQINRISDEQWSRKGRNLKFIYHSKKTPVPYVHLHDLNQNRRTVAVKRLVVEAFFPEESLFSYKTNHIKQVNGDVSDCRLSNLYIERRGK